jgi:hypothetical protein
MRREARAHPPARRRWPSVQREARRRGRTAADLGDRPCRSLPSPAPSVAATRTSDFSRVRQEGASGDPLLRAPRRPRRTGRRQTSPRRRSRHRYFATKCLLMPTFEDGRGWFRTSVLSRVKHGVCGALRRRNACKPGQTVAPVSARRWAWYGPIRLGLAQRMAQRRDPPARPRGRKSRPRRSGSQRPASRRRLAESSPKHGHGGHRGPRIVG